MPFLFSSRQYCGFWSAPNVLGNYLRYMFVFNAHGSFVSPPLTTMNFLSLCIELHICPLDASTVIRINFTVKNVIIALGILFSRFDEHSYNKHNYCTLGIKYYILYIVDCSIVPCVIITGRLQRSYGNIQTTATVRCTVENMPL